MKYKVIQRIYILIFALGVFVLLPSCEKDVTDKFDLGTQNQVVLQSFISPQDSWVVVRLRRTQPAVGRRLSGEELKVKDATVTMTDGNQTVTLPYEVKSDRYQVQASVFPIVAGKSYTVNVSTASGSKLSAQTTVPLSAQITIKSYSLKEKSQEFGGEYTSLTYKWSDAIGVENYYKTLAYRIASPAPGSSQIRREEFHNKEKSIDAFVSDANSDGQELTSNELISPSRFSDDFPVPYKLHLSLLVIDKNYYLFQRSLLRQNSSDDNPFAEPALIFSNVQGGLGIFASSNLVEEVKDVN
jgi:hypothetical protein